MIPCISAETLRIAAMFALVDEPPCTKMTGFPLGLPLCSTYKVCLMFVYCRASVSCKLICKQEANVEFYRHIRHGEHFVFERAQRVKEGSRWHDVRWMEMDDVWWWYLMIMISNYFGWPSSMSCVFSYWSSVISIRTPGSTYRIIACQEGWYSRYRGLHFPETLHALLDTPQTHRYQLRDVNPTPRQPRKGLC